MGTQQSVYNGFWVGSYTLLTVLLLTPNLLGQDLNPRATTFAGGSFLKGERTFTVGGEPFRSEFANGGKVGFRGAVDLTDHWAVEGAYSFGTNNLRIVELEKAPPRVRAFGTRVHQLTGNALYFLNEPRERIRPFATAGLGLARFSPTSDAKAIAAQRFVEEPAALRSSNKLEFNFGVGLEAKAKDRFGVRFNLRDHIARIPRFGVPVFPVSGFVHDFEISAEILIYLKR